MIDPPSRPSRGSRGAACAAVALALAFGPASHADAATPRKRPPCPTVGVQLAPKDGSTRDFRVWRRGGKLFSCVRLPSQRRRVRQLGLYGPDTKVAVQEPVVSWTTRRSTPTGPADTVRTVDTSGPGGRWLVSTHAVPATPAAPARDQTVVGLTTAFAMTAWVTADGTVVAAVRDSEEDRVPFLLDGAAVPHLGRLYALRTLGADRAAGAAAALSIDNRDAEADECGGSETVELTLPGIDPAATSTFSTFQDVSLYPRGCSAR